MSFLNCNFTSLAPSNFLVYALFLCTLGIVLTFCWAVDATLRNRAPSSKSVLLILGAVLGVCGVAGPLLSHMAATGGLWGRTCLPNPLVALWGTVFAGALSIALVALRHVYRQRKERSRPLYVNGSTVKSNRVTKTEFYAPIQMPNFDTTY
jgi:hypothetical protein